MQANTRARLIGLAIVGSAAMMAIAPITSAAAGQAPQGIDQERYDYCMNNKLYAGHDPAWKYCYAWAGPDRKSSFKR